MHSRNRLQCRPSQSIVSHLCQFAQKAEIQAVANGVFQLSDQHRAEYQLDSFQYVDAEKIGAALKEGAVAAQEAK